MCQAEILAGIAVLPRDRRRAELEGAARAVFMQDFAGRVLPFDGEAAIDYADIFAARQRSGRPIATIGLIVASIARSRGAAVATRDIGGFEGCGFTLIDPWEAS